MSLLNIIQLTVTNMAFLRYSDQDILGIAPQGWNQPFSVLPNEPFNVTDAIKGSVASWQIGDFNYDIGSQFQDVLTSGQPLTSEFIKALQDIDISPDTSDFLYIPVCETLDLRFFPPAVSSGATGCK